MQKFIYAAIGAVFTLVVSYSLISWADSTNTTTGQNSQTSQTNSSTNGDQISTIQGQISFLDPTSGKLSVFDGTQNHSLKTDAQTKVLINQKEDQLGNLKTGDQVEVVCNSLGNVRYVVLTKDAGNNSPTTANATKNGSSTNVAPTIQNNGTNPSADNGNGMSTDKAEKSMEKVKIVHDQGKHKGWYKNQENKHEEDDHGHDD